MHAEGATAREDAEGLLLINKKTAGLWKEKNLVEVKTASGKTGCLLECEATLSGVKSISHDFFFRSKKGGNIRISIMSRAEDVSWRSELDKLVLDTFGFTDGS